MSSPLDKLLTLPMWQLAAGWVGGALLIAGGWHVLFYSDAVVDLETIESQHGQAENELKELEVKLANFEEEMEKAARAQREIDKSMEFLPLSQASLGHLMRTFQQHGHLAGLSIQQWRPGAEELQQYYARRPVDLKASGSWNQVGEFFRRVSEMRKIVNVEKLSLTAGKDAVGSAASEDVVLNVTFTASTFRFLTDEERQGGRGIVKKSSRRKKH